MGEIGEHWRDVNAHRKRERHQQREQDMYVADCKAANLPRCWDWMIVSGLTHYARDRASFKTYEAVYGIAGGALITGIGSVELKVRKSPTSNATTTIILEDVLQMPFAICNGLIPQRVCDSQSGGEITQAFDKDRQPLFYGTPFLGLSRLVIDGAPKGVSPLQKARDEGCMGFTLSINASKEELDAILSQRM